MALKLTTPAVVICYGKREQSSCFDLALETFVMG